MIFFKGLRFGILLQLAIGPVSVFIFNLACKNGFCHAVLGVIAATLVDGLYFLLASFGVSPFLERKNAQKVFKIFGAITLMLFGANIIVKVLELRILPQFGPIAANQYQSAFIQGIVITASNPLTILFWAGIFSAKASASNYHRRELTLFGAGAVLATLVFKTGIALIGATAKQFLPPLIINFLNTVVGLTLLYFAFRLIIPLIPQKKDKGKKACCLYISNK
ncbi:MAG: LysE family translocator [Firmicutes bacterium]|nr:LysE family translocator [Bacillota bacterium]